MFSTETLRTFVRRCQKRVDQELDIGTNFWSLAEMLEYINEGVREVAQAVRETHENWFVREMHSTDGVKRVGGRDYDTALLGIVSEREKLILPPDFRELRLFEAEREDGEATPALVLEHVPMAHRTFRENVPVAPTTFEPVLSGAQHYRYDIVYSAEEGPYILLAPPYRFTATVNTRMMYVAATPKLGIGDSFEGTAFTEEMVDAVLAHVALAAARKEGLKENVQDAERTWSLKRELSTRAAGPRTTRDHQHVEGYLEEEL